MRPTQVGYYLAIFVGLGLACAVSVTRGHGINVRQHWVLMAVSTLLWLAPGHRTLVTLQTVIGFFLCCVPIGRATQLRLALSVFGHHVSVSVGIVLLVLFLLGYVTSWAGRRRGESRTCWQVIGAPAWSLGYGVLAGHIAFLWLMLSRTYGYGYEKSLAALGQLGLFAVACMSLRRALADLHARRIICCVLFVTFLLAALLGSFSLWQG